MPSPWHHISVPPSSPNLNTVRLHFCLKKEEENSSVVLIPIFLTTNKMPHPLTFTVHSYFLFCEHLSISFTSLSGRFTFSETFAPTVNISWIVTVRVL